MQSAKPLRPHPERLSLAAIFHDYRQNPEQLFTLAVC
jgi:hypothetical protein